MLSRRFSAASKELHHSRRGWASLSSRSVQVPSQLLRRSSTTIGGTSQISLLSKGGAASMFLSAALRELHHNRKANKELTTFVLA